MADSLKAWHAKVVASQGADMSYFKPLRCKLGVVTLLMACVFMGGWVRSPYLSDDVWVILDTEPELTCLGLSSLDQQLAVICLWPNQVSTTKRIGWSEYPTEQRRNEFNQIFDPKRLWYGFGFVDTLHSGHNFNAIFAPYWSIVAPLTAMSAYLLLSRPRGANQVESSASTPNHL